MTGDEERNHLVPSLPDLSALALSDFENADASTASGLEPELRARVNHPREHFTSLRSENACRL